MSHGPHGYKKPKQPMVHCVKCYETSGQIFAVFSVIDGFGQFLMRSLHKNIQLMLKFLKGPFLNLHFSYYVLMTFLMMLSVILLHVLMILLSTLNGIRHLVCGNN